MKESPEIPKFKDQFFSKIFFIPLAFTIVYPIFFLNFFPELGLPVYMFSFLAVIVSGWLLGFKYALIFSALESITNFLLSLAIGYEPLDAFTGGIPSMLIMIALGAILGRLHDLSLSVNMENILRRRTEEELKKTLKELKRSNMELEQFAYAASHDLQEPIRMVHSYLKLLEKNYLPSLDDKARDFIHYAMDGAEWMQRLIQDLLTYSRIVSKIQPFEKLSLELPLSNALKNLEVVIREKQARITNVSMPDVFGDLSQLGQLFQNLISNALKFCKCAVPEIQVSLKEEQEFWIVGVTDNGIGITKNQTERIFLIFQRLHTREEYEGTGIGLSVCKKIVERHGGRLWVESSPGKGSTFYFSLAKKLK